MANNLAQYFAQAQQVAGSGDGESPQSLPSSGLQRTPSSYSIHSKAVDAHDEKHFENTSFQLKRTRSVGLLDEFIEPTKKLIEQDQSQHQDQEQNSEPTTTTRTNISSFDYDDDEDNNQFIENVDDEPQLKPKDKKNIVYTYDDDIDEANYETQYNNENKNHYSDSLSPSPSGTPDLHQPHDDNDIVYEPQRHVDYLSHDWEEEDISKSWRYIVERRKDVANSARLENASWRTWAQAKYNLKTVSPESVNWLKDSDVTWLYGPLYQEPEHDSLLEDADKKYGSDTESSSVTAALKMKKKKKAENPRTKAIKPILKKRTVTEMLSQPSRINIPNNTHNVNSPPSVDDDFDLISRKVNSQYSKGSSTKNNSITNVQVRSNPNTSNLASSVLSANTQNDDEDSIKSRRVHFNDTVDQCISLNYVSDNEQDYEGEDEAHEEDSGDEGEDSDESDDEGGFFLKVRSPSTASLHNKEFVPSLSSGETEKPKSAEAEINGTLNQNNRSKSYTTISPLPPTSLNHGSDEEEEEQENANFTMSHNTNTNRGFNYHYDYNSVFIGDEKQCRGLLDSVQYEYEDAPQHLEGINMVDVPDNIVLGSNIEIVDAPAFGATEAPAATFPNTKVNTDGTKPQLSINPEVPPPQPARTSSPSLAEQLKNQQDQQQPKQKRKSGFSFDDTDSESESDQESQPFSSSTISHSASSNKNFGENLGKVSSSPSYASLSDVAAQGFISQSPNNNLSDVISGYGSSTNGKKNDVADLQKDFNNLNANEPESAGSPKEKGFRSSILNSWKKHSS